MNSEKLIVDIKFDNTSGASELMIKAVECLLDFSESFDGESEKDFYYDMLNIGRQLIDAQPSMAPLFFAVNKLLLALEYEIKRGSTLTELTEIVKNTSQELLSYSENALLKIQNNCVNLIENAAKILTHSYSSTVIKSLIFAHQNGKKVEVFVTESRPILEGRRTARILAENKIRTVLIADMASFYFLDDLDMIITGCDCICQKGIVNKIGTKGLAIAASHYGIPSYVLSEKSKFLPLKFKEEPFIEAKDPKEIFEGGNKIETRNIYFDITPHRFFKGIVTEEKMLLKSEIEDLLAAQEVCQGLSLG
ncbi:MAG: translation initiation factor eIF-2B [Thermoplasmata archaeon]|nr:MAG: translation initiation factor eIF-2B [Thermoplasmata archaeon]